MADHPLTPEDLADDDRAAIAEMKKKANDDFIEAVHRVIEASHGLVLDYPLSAAMRSLETAAVKAGIRQSKGFVCVRREYDKRVYLNRFKDGRWAKTTLKREATVFDTEDRAKEDADKTHTFWEIEQE